MNEIIEFIFNLLPPEKKQRNNGWYFFNCPSCFHTELADKKKEVTFSLKMMDLYINVLIVNLNVDLN